MSNSEIWLIGTGLAIDRHLTPEAERALRQSRKVYHLTAFHEKICEYCDTVVNWKDIYLSSTGSDIYDDMAEILLDDAEKLSSVSLAVYGHPLIYVDTSRMVIERAAERDIFVHVIPGISSIDVLLQHLLLEVGLSGLQILEPNQLLYNNIYPNPYIACLIMQIGAVGQENLRKNGEINTEGLLRLKELLLQSYSDSHPVVLITCPYLQNMKEIRHMSTIAELDQVASLIHTGMTLYIPPLNSTSQASSNYTSSYHSSNTGETLV